MYLKIKVHKYNYIELKEQYEADVEIPQTFVSLDKLDEEEGEDVTVDDEE